MPVTSHPPSVRDLADALARYGAGLPAGAGFRANGLAAARAYFETVPRADQPASGWAWVRALAEWPAWCPHRLERRLLMPDESELARVVGACRAAQADRPGWRVPFMKGDAPDVKALLGAAADLLDAMREPAPESCAALEPLVALGRDVDEAVARLAGGWPPVRLARLVARLVVPSRTHAYPVLGEPDEWRQALETAGVVVRASDEGIAWWRCWLGAEGGDWFHDLAALATESAEARRWLLEQCATLSVGCYPRVSLEDGAISWPEDVPVHVPGVRLSTDADRGWTVERFSAAPAGARFTVPCGDNGPLSAALEAWHALAGPVASAARDRLALSITRSLNETTPPSAADVLAVLDGLLQPETSSAHSPDRIPTSIRAWAETGGWRVLIGSEETAEEQASTRPVFKRDVPAGAVVRTKAFGLAGAEGVVRPAEVVVSAGPPPSGLAELEALVGGESGEALEEFKAALRGLRAAGAGGYLELAVTDLHQLFWDRVRLQWANAKAADAAGDALAGMLRESFNLLPLLPRHFRDHPPDWVTVPPGARMVTGRVTRVLRPGLTCDGALRLPAVVEAE